MCEALNDVVIPAQAGIRGVKCCPQSTTLVEFNHLDTGFHRYDGTSYQAQTKN